MKESQEDWTLRFLHLEDDPLDTELVRELLQKQGELQVIIDRVDTLDAFQSALEQGGHGLILSDYTLPGMDPLEALRLARRIRPDVPYIFVSGTLGEELAIETIKLGATDYVLKQRIERLVPAVHRALQGAEAQAQRKQTERELSERDQRLRVALDAAELGAWTYTFADHRWELDERAQRLYGTRELILIDDEALLKMIHPDDLAPMWQCVRVASDPAGEGHYRCEYRLILPGGGIRWLRAWGQVEFAGEGAERRPVRMMGATRDMTASKQAEEALRQSESSLRSFYESAAMLMGIVELTDADEIVHIYDNPAAARFFGTKPEHTTGRNASDLGAPSDAIRQWIRHYRESEALGRPVAFEYIHRTPRGPLWLSAHVAPIEHSSPGRMRFSYVAEDITQRKLAENRLQRFFDSGIVGMITWTVEGAITGANDKFLEMVGYTREDLNAGRVDWARMTPPEYRHKDAYAIEELLATGVDTPYEKEYLRKDGTRIPIVVGAAMLDEARHDGVAFVLDISERKQAESLLRKSEERYHRLFEEDLTGDFISSIDGKILICNPAFARIFGFASIEEALGTSILDLYLNPSERAPLLARLKAEGRTERLEIWRRRRDGQPIYIVENLVADFNDQGEITEIKGYVFDDTERKRAEEALRRANEELATANERLADADRRKDEFLAMLAHELRNPLAPVRNAVQILSLAGPKEPMLRRQCEIIDRQVTHMARLLDDLLDVSRITRGKINLKKRKLRLADILARAVETATPLIEAHHHTLTVTLHADDEQVCGDFDRLIQVVGNLLTNAAKYTEEGGRIWLESAREDGEIIIRVRDTGIGIAPELLPKVFDVFTQAERAMDRAQGGLGLGLTLVRSLMELHGGRVEARSRGLGRGSEFILRLPAFAEEAAPEPTQDVSTNGGEGTARRILVVDDVIDTANSLCELLTLMGHEVHVAYEGNSAIKLARQLRPDVILLDIGLPGMNGLEVARQIRRDPALEGAILVALTGYGQDEDRRRAQEAGFDRHFTKPVELDAVKMFLERMGR